MSFELDPKFEAELAIMVHFYPKLFTVEVAY
jgi:hypothetical protein